jgi:hypothetical protein
VTVFENNICGYLLFVLTQSGINEINIMVFWYNVVVANKPLCDAATRIKKSGNRERFPDFYPIAESDNSSLMA